MPKILAIILLSAVASNSYSIDESDCEGRAKLAFDIASKRDQGYPIEKVFSSYSSNNISDRTLHNIANSVYQFSNFNPRKLAALENKACKMSLQGIESHWQWTAQSGTYTDGTKYSAAAISQNNGAIFLKFESGILTFAFSIRDYKEGTNASVIIDGNKFIPGKGISAGNNTYTLLYSDALKEPARSFILSMINSQSIILSTNNKEYEFSTNGAKKAIITSLEAAGLVK